MHLKDVAQNFNISNFFIYCCLLVVSVLLSLQVGGVIRWSYGVIFIPLWVWKTLTLIATIVGVIVFIKKKKLRKEKEYKKHFITMIQSFILQFIIFIQEILIAVNLDLRGDLSWSAVFVPLYVLFFVSIAGCIFSCCLRKCSVELEVLGFINLLQIIFLAIRLDGAVTWNWAIVLIPTWILLCLTCVLIIFYACLQYCLINAEANQQVTELKVPLVATTVVAFSLAVISFTIFLALVVSQLDWNLSAPYTATFVPLHVSILLLLPTTFTRQPANPLWFGLQKSFMDVLIEMCPVFKEYFNVSWSKKADEAEKLSEISAKLKSKYCKQQLVTVQISNAIESKNDSYEDIMTPD